MQVGLQPQCNGVTISPVVSPSPFISGIVICKSIVLLALGSTSPTACLPLKWIYFSTFQVVEYWETVRQAERVNHVYACIECECDSKGGGMGLHVWVCASIVSSLLGST